MFKYEVLNVVHFSEPFFAFEPLPFDEFFHLLVLVFLFPAKIIQNKLKMKLDFTIIKSVSWVEWK